MTMVKLAMAWALALTALIAEALHFDVEAAKEYPVSKVVALLKDMQAEMQKEADADEEVYEKLACWCETNNKGKTAAIKSAEVSMQDLTNTIEKSAALSASLKVKIAALKKEIAADVKSLEVATAMREKEQAAFLGEEKEMIESIRALKAALQVLNKHQGGSKDAKAKSFLSSKVLQNAYATAKAELEKHAVLLEGAITPSQKKTILGLVQSDAPSFNQPYEPQSGQIFGILSQMMETFEGDLSSSQKEEISDQKTFADLKKAKEEEIAIGQAAVDAKEQQLAQADETLAQAKEDLDDVSAAFSADKKFLMELKVKCKMTDKEWEERQALRQKEIAATSKAIEILSSDESRELFSKTFNPEPSFIQVSHENRDRAAEALSKVANGKPKLSALASAVRLDPFPKVKKAIDDMIAGLLKEKKAEIEKKDFCTEKMNKNTKETKATEHTKKRLDSKIAGLKQQIEELTDAIKMVDAEIADFKAGREKAKNDRKAENNAFKAEIAEQQATQKVLNKALGVLKEVFAEGKVFLQTNSTYKPFEAKAEPESFETKKANRASTGIIMLIEQIIANAKELENAAHHDEATAMDEYTTFVQTTNEALEAKDDQRTDLSSQKAQADKDLTSAGTELDGTVKELEALATGAGDLHKDCDFMLKNFEVTQKGRDEEVEALRRAKDYLSGMKPSA